MMCSNYNINVITITEHWLGIVDASFLSFWLCLLASDYGMPTATKVYGGPAFFF